MLDENPSANLQLIVNVELSDVWRVKDSSNGSTECAVLRAKCRKRHEIASL